MEKVNTYETLIICCTVAVSRLSLHCSLVTYFKLIQLSINYFITNHKSGIYFTVPFGTLWQYVRQIWSCYNSYFCETKHV